MRTASPEGSGIGVEKTPLFLPGLLAPFPLIVCVNDFSTFLRYAIAATEAAIPPKKDMEVS